MAAMVMASSANLATSCALRRSLTAASRCRARCSHHSQKATRRHAAASKAIVVRSCARCTRRFSSASRLLSSTSLEVYSCQPRSARRSWPSASAPRAATTRACRLFSASAWSLQWTASARHAASVACAKARVSPASRATTKALWRSRQAAMRCSALSRMPCSLLLARWACHSARSAAIRACSPPARRAMTRAFWRSRHASMRRSALSRWASHLLAAASRAMSSCQIRSARRSWSSASAPRFARSCACRLFSSLYRAR
mmetsp:Transcript_64936/g.180072  ORF Transcript_64936/g.180072 Transcript_64936/m.180072 type:complete len:257 (-) Transcript_64936:961-1731(-)